jgi:hypothetical protein
MSYVGTENNPLFIPLTAVAVDTGWIVDGSVATHVACNDGNLTLNNYAVTAGTTYKISVIVNYITSGILYANLGGTSGANMTSSGLWVQTITASNNGGLLFYANGNCQIKSFAIEVSTDIVSQYAQNTIAFAEKINKWTSFYTFVPDSAFSMFTKTFSFQSGNVYLHEANTPFRCNFYGTQYPSTIYFSTNQQPSIGKLYQSINYQANQLLVTPPSGITTQGGQTSELISQDFLQMSLADNVSPSVFVYQVESLYKANFLRDISDIVNGDTLIGNYMQIGLQTTAPSGILTLFSTEVEYVHLRQNIR